VAPRPVVHVDELKNRLPPPGMTGRYPDLVNDEERRPPQKADRALGACATHPSSLSPSIAETSSGSSMAPLREPLNRGGPELSRRIKNPALTASRGGPFLVSLGIVQDAARHGRQSGEPFSGRCRTRRQSPRSTARNVPTLDHRSAPSQPAEQGLGERIRGRSPGRPGEPIIWGIFKRHSGE